MPVWIKSTFFRLVRCLYNKPNNTWLLGDMEFLFSCSTRYLIRLLRAFSWDIELNTQREITFFRAPMHYSLFINCYIFCTKRLCLLTVYALIHFSFMPVFVCFFFVVSLGKLLKWRPVKQNRAQFMTTSTQKVILVTNEASNAEKGTTVA